MGYRYPTKQVLAINDKTFDTVKQIITDKEEWLEYKIRTTQAAIHKMIKNYSTEELYEFELMELMTYRKKCIETWQNELKELSE